MKRILHVITSLQTGGAEKLMVDLLPRLKDMGNEVEILVFDGIETPFTKRLSESGIKIHSIRIGGSVYDLRNIIATIPFLKKYDVIHTHNTACQYFVAFAKFISSAKCEIVTTEHSTSNRRRGKKVFALLDNWMYHQYKRLICVSDIAGQNIKDYVGDQNLPIETIPNGIDFNLFSTTEPNLELLQKYSEVFRIVMVAGFRYEKDHPTLIKAVACLPSKYHLFLIGDGARRAEYERMVQDLKCEEQVHFLGVRADVPSLLRASNVVVMSSHREGLSLSNLEGMACGKPFVASDVEGLHEIVNGYGVLFPHENATELASIISKITCNPAYAEEISLKCQERAAQFDIKLMAKRYNEVYESLIQGK